MPTPLRRSIRSLPGLALWAAAQAVIPVSTASADVITLTETLHTDAFTLDEDNTMVIHSVGANQIAANGATPPSPVEADWCWLTRSSAGTSRPYQSGQKRS